jgi:hypothetical protein
VFVLFCCAGFCFLVFPFCFHNIRHKAIHPLRD